MKAQELIDLARQLLIDPNGDRWSDPTLLAHLNDAVVFVTDFFPQAVAAYDSLPLAPGVRQTLPADVAHVVRFTHSEAYDGTPGRYVSETTLYVLDTQYRGWRSAPADAEVHLVVLDERDEDGFWVYPAQPAGTTQVLRGLIARYPAAITDLVNDDVPLPDRYKIALANYVAHLAFLGDAQAPADTERAEFHRNRALENMLGREELARALRSGRAPSSLLRPLLQQVPANGAG